MSFGGKQWRVKEEWREEHNLGLNWDISKFYEGFDLQRLRDQASKPYGQVDLQPLEGRQVHQVGRLGNQAAQVCHPRHASRQCFEQCIHQSVLDWHIR